MRRYLDSVPIEQENGGVTEKPKTPFQYAMTQCHDSCMDDDDNTTTSRVLENAYYDDSVCILRLVEYIMHIALANMYVDFYHYTGTS